MFCFQIGCSAENSDDRNYLYDSPEGDTTKHSGDTDGLSGFGGGVEPTGIAGSGDNTNAGISGYDGQPGAMAGSDAEDAGQLGPGAGWAMDTGIGDDGGGEPEQDSAVAQDAGTIGGDGGGEPEQDSAVAQDAGTIGGDGGGEPEQDSAVAQDSGTFNPDDDPCGPDAQPVTGATRTTDVGTVYITLSGTNEILRFNTTMIVPSDPQPQRGTLFLWPGLQPLSRDNVAGYGVLQPVLTWGPTCAPGAPNTYDRWWISGVYVGTPPGSFRMICEGGEGMTVATGDKLDIEFVLNGTIWSQVITNQSNGNSVDFDYDLKGQGQQWAIFTIEIPMGSRVRPVDDLIFTDSVITFSESRPDNCVPSQQGSDDFFSQPRVSADGKTCCISKVIVRGAGVPASSPNEYVIPIDPPESIQWPGQRFQMR